jgi:2-polyprenyl-6-methoxyphenol hydroxylase-like FAD-dependent oxidoreductase
MARVVIAGAGPESLALAVILARYQVACIVLDPRSGPAGGQYLRTWSPGGLALLAWLGLVERCAEAGRWRAMHEVWDATRCRLALPLADTFPGLLDLDDRVAESLLAEAAMETGLVEIRRGHKVEAVLAGTASPDGGAGDEAAMRVVTGTGERYVLAADWAVGCDGPGSAVRQHLGIGADVSEKGLPALVADLEADGGPDPGTSRSVLLADRRHGLVSLGPGRLRLVARLNPTDIPRYLRDLPGIAVRRLAWSGRLRAAASRSSTCRSGRWLLAGTAARAPGASACAALPGDGDVWRLGWRLAIAAQGDPLGPALLADYEREHAAMPLGRHGPARLLDMRLPAGAAGILALLARLHFLSERLARSLTDERARLPVAGSADRPRPGPWRMPEWFGSWRTGAPAPADACEAAGSAFQETGRRHALVPIGGWNPGAEASLMRAVSERMDIPADSVHAPPQAPWRTRQGPPAVALMRPDRRIVGIYTA